MSAKPASPRRRGRPEKFNDRRLEVLQTAARTFSELGFRQATLEDIAGALGITRPALYHYADSKDALLAECSEIARQALAKAVDRARVEPNGLAQIESFFSSYCAIVCDDFGRCMMITSLSEMEETQRKSTHDAQLALAQDVTDMIRCGIEDGSIRQCDAVLASRCLFATFNGVARWWTDRDRAKPVALAASLLDLFFTGLIPRDGSTA